MNFYFLDSNLIYQILNITENLSEDAKFEITSVTMIPSITSIRINWCWYRLNLNQHQFAKPTWIIGQDSITIVFYIFILYFSRERLKNWPLLIEFHIPSETLKCHELTWKVFLYIWGAFSFSVWVTLNKRNFQTAFFRLDLRKDT